MTNEINNNTKGKSNDKFNESKNGEATTAAKASVKCVIFSTISPTVTTITLHDGELEL